MRQLFLLILTFSLLSTTTTSAQSMSENDRLFYTAKIWGYLKYYHPLVGSGAYDWDQKLQSVLEGTAGIQSYEAYSTYMYRWLYAMGPLKPCASCRQRSQNKEFLKNFDLSWTQNRKFSAELRKFFKNIENNRFQGSHHYIDQGKAGQFAPKSESQDFDFIWKYPEQRMLPLFRYWNYIEYFSPYKYLTDQSWDDVLKEMIPVFQRAETKLDLHLAMLELIVKVDDGQSGFTTNLIEEMPLFNYLPVRFELIENEAVVTEIIDNGKAQAADLQVGDILVSVNNQSVRSIHESNKKYIWGSNGAIKDRSISYTLFMGMKGTAEVAIRRGASTQTKNLTLYKFADLNYEKENSAKWNTLQDSITFQVKRYDSLMNDFIPVDSIGYVDMGYVDMGQLLRGDVAPMMDELMDKDAIIFDVRNSPKGTYGSIAKYLNKSDTVFATFIKPDLTYPGKFTWQNERSCGESNPDYYKGKVILLVNEKTQGHAEFTCMCLQTAPNVTTIGSQTAGAGGNISRLRILQRLNSAVSGTGVYYPDGSEIQRAGVSTDIEVKPTLAGIFEGRDELLESAIEVIKEEIEEKEMARLEEIQRLKEMAIMEAMKADTVQMDFVQPDSVGIDQNR